VIAIALTRVLSKSENPVQVFFVGSARNVGAPYLQIASQDLVDAAAKALRTQDSPVGDAGRADACRPTAAWCLERFHVLAEAIRAAHHQVVHSASASRAAAPQPCAPRRRGRSALTSAARADMRGIAAARVLAAHRVPHT
jgi:hypothetical protein